MGNNPSGFTNCPVERVSWYDAIDFCNRLSDREGRQRVYTGSGDNITANWSANGYRLPTEAEWEYAAGGGASNRTRFGNGRDILDASEANFDVSYKEPYSNVGIYRGRTVAAGSFIPNRFGLYDMSGNVDEWCWDWEDTYPSQSQTNPRGPSSGNERVLRGGAWEYESDFARIAFRDYIYPDESYDVLGFRVVVSQ